MQSNNQTSSPSPRCAIVVFAKCPIQGKSKTRLAPLLGEDGAAQLARAMLSDVLVSLSDHCSGETLKILAYAPGNASGREHMVQILQSLQLERQWALEPMLSGDLKASDLGAKLTYALTNTRRLLLDESRGRNDGAVMFLGMDAPELPLDEIVTALLHPRTAHLCPASDGGYGMLCVPPGAPDSIFQHIRWSDPLTSLSQLKALTDANVPVKLGRLMNDIDEPKDVQQLTIRLAAQSSKGSSHSSDIETDVLLQNSFGMRHDTSTCPHTTIALQRLGLLKVPEVLL